MPLLPGTCYIEMARNMAVAVHGGRPFTLSRVAFQGILFLDGTDLDGGPLARASHHPAGRRRRRGLLHLACCFFYFRAGRAQRLSCLPHSYWRRPFVAGRADLGACRVILTSRNDARARRYALGRQGS